MENDPFQKLTQQELYELSLCGIYNAEQLLKTDVDTLLADLEKARRFFPDKQFSFNRTKIETIFILCTPSITKQEFATSNEELQIENMGPTTGFRHSRQERNKKRMQQEKKVQEKLMHSSVCTSHPWVTTFAAFSVLLLIIPAVSIFALPVMMATDTLPAISLPKLVFLILVAPSIPYLIFSRISRCPVCHIPAFSFNKYTRNRAAHYIPGLGYNASTALHIIFRRQFICPGCGTPIKLIKRKSGRAHH